MPLKNAESAGWGRSLAFGLLLFAAVCAAYANAWPNDLIFDDKPFLDYKRFDDWSAVPEYFSENAWAARGLSSNLYRPLLWTSITLDASLFEDWFAGYHLINILLHACVTLCVFGLLARVLSMDDHTAKFSIPAAFFAALLFAVHPVHTEVVNSIFNRSSILSALGMTIGLWWLLRNLETRPVRGWTGLLIAYTAALFCRETAAVLPGIAAVLVLLYAHGDGQARLRKTLPVLLLLVPLAAYLVAREHALAVSALATDSPEDDWTSALRQVDSSRLLQGEVLLRAAGVWGDALRLAVWPVGLQVSYEAPGRAASWIALAVHVILLGAAVFRYRRGRKGPLAGLLIFYVALLPSSRLIGDDTILPHLNARYLYEPMIALALLAAYGLVHLRSRFDRTLAAVPVVLAVMLMTPSTWARNVQWTDEKMLFESDYRKGVRTTNLLRLLTAVYLREADFPRVAEICDAHPEITATSGNLSSHCATAYSYLGRSEDAVTAYRISAESPRERRRAYWNLGKHYLRQQDWEMARSNLERAVEAEQNPARKAYYAAYMIMLLYPATPEKWLEARAQLEQAVRLQPGYGEAQALLDQINQAVGGLPSGEP